jgi:hypothetical protein
MITLAERRLTAHGTRQIEVENVSEKVISERGTGGATFAAALMIIGGIFGFSKAYL